MAVIKLVGMEFTAYHGVYATEKENGNRFTVDIELEADTTRAQESDNLTDTVDYSTIHALVETEMQQPSELLEHVAQRIKNSVVAHVKGITALQVAVTKHNPPMKGVDKVTVIV